MIRAFRPGDAGALADLQRRSIAQLGPRAYSPKQIDAWLSRTKSPDFFLHEALAHSLVVAQPSGRPGGYVLLEADGHLDHLYVDPACARTGIATRLLAWARQAAHDRALTSLFSEVSEVARPVFEKSGWRVEHRRDLSIDGVAIHNYAMRLTL